MSAQPQRKPQLEYSEQQQLMLDEEHRRTKARKVLSVLYHFLGRQDLKGLTVIDIGCSAGFIADEMAGAGARTYGLDIDVPGLQKARARFGENADFVCAAGERMPFADGSIDVVVLNHIYEHVVDPDAVLRDIQRVLKPGGVVYLGLMNRFGVIEPHYRLPFLSWLPQGLANRYVRTFKKADEYYERPRSRRNLRRMVTGLQIWDYTVPVVCEPQAFNNDDTVNAAVSRLPASAVRAAMGVIPTYVWLGVRGGRIPEGRDLRQPPRQLTRPDGPDQPRTEQE